MKWWLVLLLAGCDQLFGFTEVPPPNGDASDAHDAAPAGTWSVLAPGTQHVCGLDIAGYLACAGQDAAGGNTTVPTRMGDPSKTWSAVSSGPTHSCGILGGAVYCWGTNTYGELTGTPGADAMSPQLVPLPIMSYTQVGAGGFHSCALGIDTSVTCWGNSQQVGGTTGIHVMPGTTFQSLSVGYDHSCAIDRNGGVWCWGGNNHSQIEPCFPGPCEVDTPVNVYFNGNPAIAVSAGGEATCAIIGSNGAGEVWCRGSGRLLTGGGNDQQGVQMTQGEDWTAVAVGGDTVCAMRGGEAFCWGRVSAGGIGDGVLTEYVASQAATFGIPAATLAVTPGGPGVENACVVANGDASCWGPPATPMPVPSPPG